MSRALAIAGLVALGGCQAADATTTIAVPPWLQQAQVQYPLTVEVLAFRYELQIRIQDDAGYLAPFSAAHRAAIDGLFQQDGPGGAQLTSTQRDAALSGELPSCAVVEQIPQEYRDSLLRCQSVVLTGPTDTAKVALSLTFGPTWYVAFTWSEVVGTQTIPLLRVVDTLDSSESGFPSKLARDLTGDTPYCSGDSFLVGTSFDFDGDGVSNFEEISVGRDPLTGWSTAAGGRRQLYEAGTIDIDDTRVSIVALSDGVLLNEVTWDAFGVPEHTLSYFTTDLSTPVWTVVDLDGLVVANESTDRIVAMRFTSTPGEIEFLDIPIATGVPAAFGSHAYPGDEDVASLIFIDEASSDPGVWVLVKTASLERRLDKFNFDKSTGPSIALPVSPNCGFMDDAFTPSPTHPRYSLTNNRAITDLGTTRIIALLLDADCLPSSGWSGDVIVAAGMLIDEAGSSAKLAHLFTPLLAQDAAPMTLPWVDPSDGSAYLTLNNLGSASQFEARNLDGSEPWSPLQFPDGQVGQPLPLGAGVALQITSTAKMGFVPLNTTVGTTGTALPLQGRKRFAGSPCGDEQMTGSGADWATHLSDIGGDRVVLSGSHPDFRDNLARTLLVVDDTYTVVADGGAGMVPCLHAEVSLYQHYEMAAQPCAGQVALGPNALYFIGADVTYHESTGPMPVGYSFTLNRVPVPTP